MSLDLENAKKDNLNAHNRFGEIMRETQNGNELIMAIK